MTETSYPTNLTDEQWQQIKTHLPKPKRRGRPPVDRRHILNALLYFVRAGCQWRMMPANFGPWQTVYHYYRTWQRAGHWIYLHDRLRALVRHAARVAWKDLRIELRSREILYTMAFFGALLVVIFAIAFPLDMRAVRGSLPGMLWTTIAFTGTIGLGRAFDRERENDTMRALLLAPVPRLAVFLGKAIATVLMVLAVAVVCAPLLAVFLNVALFAHPLPLVLIVVLGAVGIAVTGSVFAATLLKVRSRDVLLPVILYPLLIPLFVAGTKCTAALVAEIPNFDAAWYWMEFLGIYDAAFLVVSVWIFESMVIE